MNFFLDFGGERILLCDLQNSSESSRISEQTRKERSELSAQTLRSKTQRENAGTASGQRSSPGFNTFLARDD
jgi:ribosome assembly protein YihI (activator of Der GTPase)